MRKLILFLSFFSIATSTIFATGEGDRIQLTFNPIRSEITVTPGTPKMSTMTFYNNSDTVYTFTPNAENCIVVNNIGTPDCTINASRDTSIESLASWITFMNTGALQIPPKSSLVINFMIKAPVNATPGGHYGAILLNTATSSGGTIALNRRTGPLLLVTVPGDIIVNPEFGSIVSSGNGGSSPDQTITLPSYFDLFSATETGSISDKLGGLWSGLMMTFSDPETQQKIIDYINPTWDIPTLDTKKPFLVSLNIPVSNKGNVHIKPRGKITLHETDGTQLTRVGKEDIKNQNGASVGEKIVDYLPINEEEGNVLPGTDRTYNVPWYGFANMEIGDNGKQIIVYEDPSSYYTRIAKSDTSFLYPWEKLVLQNTKKMIEARVDLQYTNPVTKQIVAYNPKIPLYIQYDEIARVPNTGLILIGFLILILIYLIFRRRKKRNIRKFYPLSDTDTEISLLEKAHADIINKRKSAVKKKTTSEKSPSEDETDIKSSSQKRSIKKSPETKIQKKTVQKKSTKNEEPGA